MSLIFSTFTIIEDLPLPFSKILYVELLLSIIFCQFKVYFCHSRSSIWWKYAINATLHTIRERNRKLTKDFLVQRAKDVCAYHRVYARYLETHQLSPADTVSI